jgi:hypothetical protein
MKHIRILCIGLIALNTHLNGINAPLEDRFAFPTKNTDSLPAVLAKNHADLIESKLRHEAAFKFTEHQLPNNLKDWEIYKMQLKNEIIKKAGVVVDHKLPLNIKVTGTIQLKRYYVENITFQTRPAVYATANLYISDGKGPFPGIINTVGHWPKSKIDSTGQQAGGPVERVTTPGIFEYHESYLGASLMNIGESLMGIQISDNMRGIDLLCLLPNVDAKIIGATGASGGGNQTMWLASMDERVTAAVPVVSVGTFESYIMRSNCICELFIDGLTYKEEAGVVALIASRALKICNHKQDDNPTFYPSEMLRSYINIPVNGVGTDAL